MRLFLLSFALLFGLIPVKEEVNSKVPTEVYGIWQSVDNEFVSIYTDSNFETVFDRRSSNGSRLAFGTVDYIDGQLFVTRTDVKDQYSLPFYIGDSTLVIMKPRSNQAWIWTKVQ